MLRSTLFSLLLTCLFTACKGPECQTNEPAPTLAWQTSVINLDETVLQAFVYDNKVYYVTGYDDSELVVIDGKNGHVTMEAGWTNPVKVGYFLAEGDFLYWTKSGIILRRHLPTGAIEMLGTVGGGFNEGIVVPFEGLVAGIFHDASMTDRDYVIGVFDMATQKELFRYSVDDPQTVTNLGDPALGRTVEGDTIVAFVETTKSKLLIFNLSTQGTIQVSLPAGEYYFPYLRNIHIRDGRIYLGMRANVYCFNATTGAQLWQFQEGETSKVCRLRFWNDQLLFHSNAQNLYALDQTTGDVIWKKEVAGFPAVDQTLLGNTLYYTTGGSKNDLIGVDINDGCTRVHLEDLVGHYGGLVGATTDGYLIIYTAEWYAGYLP